MMLYSELKSKEVINICNCKKLGKIVDLELEECTGQICKIIVGRGGICCGFFSAETNYNIKYTDIKQIGPDIILVELHQREPGKN